MADNIISQHRLKELLNYNPETGVFTWVRTRGSKALAGSVAGYAEPNRYINIMLDRKLYKAHRLAWLYMYGVWPSELDHIDQCKHNNRISNLREVDSSKNKQNITWFSHNTSGHKGVTWHKANQKWQAQIKIHGKNVYLGTFSAIEDAVKARQSALSEYHSHRPGA